MEMLTNWDRFRDAVIVLAGNGPVKQRLAEAYQAHLRELDPDGLPRDLREEFVALSCALQSAPRMGSMDCVAASVRKMSDHEAARHAQSIVHLFAGLHEPPAALRAAVLRAVPSDDEIPAFLNRA